MKFLIIIPTYNENSNIASLISIIRNLDVKLKLDILIIDDSSPDGTALTIKEIMQMTLIYI